MSQYTTGTVSVINGSNAVTGVGTLWLSAGVSAGDMIILSGDTVLYTISSVISNTSLTISTNYAGTTVSGSSYIIARDFTPTYNLPLINEGDLRWPRLYSKAMQLIETQIATYQQLATQNNRGMCVLVSGPIYDEMENVASLLVPFDGLITTIRAEVDVPPEGQDILIDALVEGVSLFGELPTDKIIIIDGTTMSLTKTVNTSVSQYQTLSINIDQVGVSPTGGEDLRIIIYLQVGEEAEDLGIKFITVANSPYYLDIGDRSLWIDSSGGDVSVVMPAPSAAPGRKFTIIKDSSDTNIITISADSGTINGSSNVELDSPYGSFALMSNGTRYNIVT